MTGPGNDTHPTGRTRPGGRHHHSSSSSTPRGFRWTRIEGGWLRQTNESFAAVTETCAWSASSATSYGHASGQSGCYNDAFAAVRAILRTWGQYPVDMVEVVDDLDDPSAPTTGGGPMSSV